MYTVASAEDMQCREMTSSNTTAFQLEATRCTANGCMHWRWSKTTRFADALSKLPIIGLFITYRGKGYCGKSGKP